MKPFLKQVADHYMAEGNISRRCFIFPNNRSKVFFMKYLGEAVKDSGVPIFSPKTFTIRDFFFKIAGTKAADRVDLLLELWECYHPLAKTNETLDDFIFWGDVILADFQDVDKYLVDAKKLFTNVNEYKQLQDTFSYLTDKQRMAIESFVTHFETGTVPSKGKDVKGNFLQVWNILYPLYEAFRKKLTAAGKAYEGMVYRELAERLKDESAVDLFSKVYPDVDGFVFVGLNALNECEKVVMRKMRDAHLAEFCWDFCSDMVKDRLNKSSSFMSKNVEEFHQAFELEAIGSKVPNFSVVSVPSSVGQTKLIPDILKQGDCAIVLPDETLLLPVLNSIPLEVKDINVTMGYPMGNTSFHDFLVLVNAMQLHTRKKDGEWLFYHSQVWSIFSSGLFTRALASDKDAHERIKAIKKAKNYYISQEMLSGNPVMDLVFRPALKDAGKADADQIHDLAEYQKDLIKGICGLMAGDSTYAVELEFAKKAYNAIARLQERRLAVLPATYFRILEQLLRPMTVPFKGEPLKGLQIMGPLETRALDFQNLLILSCNEGVFPHRSVSSSFIPPKLRKGFDLPTYEHQDAINAYYFYRLIQRAENVTLVYDSRTEGLKSGEESRYIKQLEYHFNVPLNRSFVKAEASGVAAAVDIAKTEEDIETIRNAKLSASSLKNYLDCPARFYYGTVRGLNKKDEVSEDLDAGMLGDAYHKTMQQLYDRPIVTKDYLVSLQKQRKMVKEVVRSKIMELLHSLEVTGRDLVAEDVIVEYVMKTIERDVEYLTNSGLDKFEIVGLEKKYEIEIEGFHFKGYVDRLDSCRPGEVRVVDYKTGKVEQNEVDITDAKAEKIVTALFTPGGDNSKRPKIALQLYLYDVMCGSDPALAGARLVNTIYPPAGLFTSPVKDVPVSAEFMRLMADRLKSLLAEMVSPEIPFTRTDDPKTCSMCNFKMICGR